MLLQYVRLLVTASLNNLRSLCLTSGMLGFVGRCLLARWVDGCTSNRLASSSVIAFISGPICVFLTTKCFFGADAFYSLVHVLDTAAINLDSATTPNPYFLWSFHLLLSVGMRSLGSIWLGVTLIEVLMLSEPL